MLGDLVTAPWHDLVLAGMIAGLIIIACEALERRTGQNRRDGR